MVAPMQNKQNWVRDVVARFERPLLIYVLGFLKDMDRSRDVVQDAFLKLWQQDQKQIEDRVSAWLYKVCRNRALDIIRQEGRLMPMENIATEPADRAPEASALLETRRQTAAVLQLLDSLPPNQKEVVRLKFQQGLRYREISEITGHSVSNVGFMLHTALKTLRNQMQSKTRPEVQS